MFGCFTFAKLGCFLTNNKFLFLYYSKFRCSCSWLILKIHATTLPNYVKSCQISAKAGPKQYSFSLCILRSLWEKLTRIDRLVAGVVRAPPVRAHVRHVDSWKKFKIGWRLVLDNGDGDEGCFGPSGELLCFWPTGKKLSRTCMAMFHTGLTWKMQTV